MNSVTTSIAVVILLPVLYKVYQYLHWIYRTWFVIGTQVNKFPGEPLKWPYGNLHQNPGFNEKLNGYQKSMAAKYNRLWRMWFGPFVPFISLCHPDTIKILVKTEEPKFTDGNAGYLLAEPWLGNRLLLKCWTKVEEKQETPDTSFSFWHPQELHFCLQCGNRNSDEKSGQQKDRKERALTFRRIFRLCTLSIILRCAFSYDEKIQETGERHPYAVAVLDLSRLMVERAFNPFVRMSKFLYGLTANGRTFFKHCDYVHKVAETVISQRRETLQENPDALEDRKYLDFLDILLQARDEDGTGLSDLEIRNEVDTFMFEGHDTTASGISWALYSLAKHPEFQKKAQQEIDELLADRKNKWIMWDDLNQLPYLTMCLKESMRLWCPVPVISRQLLNPITIDGVTLPPHTLFDINIIALHHNPTVWGEDHDEYKPERFLPENINKMDNFAFLPFSAGPRNCIGQNFAFNEMKTTIARIIQRFDLSVDESHPVYPRPEVVTRAIHGIKLFMNPR
uniref:CYP4BB1 n=1 Tax=Alitta virens TaxID=880429 RepID=Q6SPQ6_ALIVI|nr:CYP4BB1 [Alitta virens]